MSSNCLIGYKPPLKISLHISFPQGKRAVNTSISKCNYISSATHILQHNLYLSKSFSFVLVTKFLGMLNEEASDILHLIHVHQKLHILPSKSCMSFSYLRFFPFNGFLSTTISLYSSSTSLFLIIIKPSDILYSCPEKEQFTLLKVTCYFASL